jgi:hypothetical protein
MYLHIGNNRNIRTKAIIGIFDTDNATVSPITRNFLKKNERARRVSSAVTEIPKSFVLYIDWDGDSSVYFSQISSSTLIKRRDVADME